ncbi:twin-arginine translocation signal domain-containing protein [Streptomyces iconiensis]|uniref:Twin-arginine translocation signal domain-containing protein n=1 Tax=Streptomyces iconiensis TaxID=1384038 RepID=A0ABT7AAP2_9ACTN|nr:twin-arginine translocation signal domain-containing protein [Streptomyces iconiensis]MDJ1138413.1 twin-arginine translocation signal domain-containing protein [Streptomyces iconiensis]
MSERASTEVERRAFLRLGGGTGAAAALAPALSARWPGYTALVGDGDPCGGTRVTAHD